MGYERIADEYRRNRVFTASPVDLVVMLYDAAISHLENAKLAMLERRRGPAGTHVSKAQRIVAELVSSLNFVDGGEIAPRLDALYAFVIDRLMRGNLRQEPDAIAEASRVLCVLRDGWITLQRSQGRGEPGVAL